MSTSRTRAAVGYTPARPRAGMAFTLIELLVVIAVIAVLLAMLAPSLGHAQRLARKAVCATNLRNLGVAIRAYATAYRSYPLYGSRFMGMVNESNTYAYGFPKVYGALAMMGQRPTHRTTWGAPAFLWEADEVYPGVLCPAMDAVGIWKQADWYWDRGYHVPAKPALHRAAIGYQWNVMLRAAGTPLRLIPGGRFPISLWDPGGASWQDYDNTQWICYSISLPNGSHYIAQAASPDEVGNSAIVAEAWDSCDPQTAPNVNRYDWRVENLLPGWHCGPYMRYTSGWPVLNGSRHPLSPNVLYVDGSVRADATRPLTPADLGPCEAGSWQGLQANTFEPVNATFGAAGHIAPRMELRGQ